MTDTVSGDQYRQYRRILARSAGIAIMICIASVGARADGLLAKGAHHQVVHALRLVGEL